MKTLTEFLATNSIGVLDYFPEIQLADDDIVINFELENKINENKYNGLVNIINEQKISKSEISQKKQQLIKESIKSFSVNDFINAIDKEFPNAISNENIIDKKNANYDEAMAFDCQINGINVQNIDKLLEICKFFRYYISKYNENKFLFEPLDTEEVTSKIKSEYGNKIYHITKNKNVDSILKNGFKVASASNNDDMQIMSIGDLQKNVWISAKTIREKIQKFLNYRYFPKRTFFIYSNEDINTIFETFRKIIYCGRGECSIIEIDLGKHNVPLFTDTVMQDSENVHYAYSTIDIPKSLITNVYAL